MNFAPQGRRRLIPHDDDVQRRIARLRQLGLNDRKPDPELDDFARRLATAITDPTDEGERIYAMVNVVLDDVQYFAGLFSSEGRVRAALDVGAATGVAEPSRTMDKDHGWCPHVLARRKALPLRDILAYPRYRGNPVQYKMGVRSYLGAPIIDYSADPEGIPLATVCLISTRPHMWKEDKEIATINEMAAELADRWAQGR